MRRSKELSAGVSHAPVQPGACAFSIFHPKKETNQ